jgi:AraC-like DNA-binding protein
MHDNYIDIDSISELHRFYGYDKPKHPLITIIDQKEVNYDNRPRQGQLYRLGLYSVFYKRIKGSLIYGRSTYDYNEGSLIFTAPHQVMAPATAVPPDEGWGLFFHPDLVAGTELGKKINQYSFFHYDSNEALHPSEDERTIIKNAAGNIAKEYEQKIDRHTEYLLIANLDLLIGYCHRFYDRQFFTRATVNKDVVQQFERLLNDYFEGAAIETGLPDVKYFAASLHLSPNYLSDLLKKYTGKTTQEHIHLQLIDRAKSLLWGSEKPVSEIAYQLGFEHPSHFTKIFRTKTGKSPTAFRHPDQKDRGRGES